MNRKETKLYNSAKVIIWQHFVLNGILLWNNHAMFNFYYAIATINNSGRNKERIRNYFRIHKPDT